MNDKIPNMDYDADEVIDSFKSKFKWPDKDDVEVVVKPKKLPKKILLSLLTTVIVGAGAYYMMIPALNFKSTDFYFSSYCSVCRLVFPLYRRKQEGGEQCVF